MYFRSDQENILQTVLPYYFYDKTTTMLPIFLEMSFWTTLYLIHST